LIVEKQEEERKAAELNSSAFGRFYQASKTDSSKHGEKAPILENPTYTMG